MASGVASGVIHIGFVSSEKGLSLSRNLFAWKRTTPVRLSAAPGAAGQFLSKRPDRIGFFRVCEVRSLFVVESARRQRVALSCSHPSGSGPRLRRGRRIGSHPDSVGTRTTSVPRRRSLVFLLRRNVANLVTGPREGPSTQRDSATRAKEISMLTDRFTCSRARRRPSNQLGSGFSQPLKQDRPPPRYLHPKTRFKSNGSRRWSM